MAWQFPVAYGGYMMPLPGADDWAKIAAEVVAKAVAEVTSPEERTQDQGQGGGGQRGSGAAGCVGWS